LTQYPSDIKKFTAFASCVRQSRRLAAKIRKVNSKGKSLKAGTIRMFGQNFIPLFNSL
jgi:hypothetical protein